MTKRVPKIALQIPVVLALVYLVLMIAVVMFGSFVYTVNPLQIVGAPLEPPFQPGLPLGTDRLGVDLLANLIAGGKATLLVALAAAASTLAIGTVVGGVAGYYGGYADLILTRVTEFFQVLPPLLLSMTMLAFLSPTMGVVILSIALVGWVQIARLVRAEVMSIRERDFVRSARSIGASDLYILRRVILPMVSHIIVISGAIAIGLAVLYESGLSFLGLTDPNVITWGRIIGTNRSYMFEAWWVVYLPGALVFATVLSITILGDALNEALDPRRRARA